jgi:hypothetical protein
MSPRRSRSWLDSSKPSAPKPALSRSAPSSSPEPDASCRATTAGLGGRRPALRSRPDHWTPTGSCLTPRQHTPPPANSRAGNSLWPLLRVDPDRPREARANLAAPAVSRLIVNVCNCPASASRTAATTAACASEPRRLSTFHGRVSSTRSRPPARLQQRCKNLTARPSRGIRHRYTPADKQ